MISNNRKIERKKMNDLKDQELKSKLKTFNIKQIGIDEPTAVVVNNVVDAHRLTDIGTYDQKCKSFSSKIF